MFGIIETFFGDYKSKIIEYGIILLVVTVLCFIVYFKGYNNGVDTEKNRLASEYAQILEDKVKENSIRLNREFNEKLKAEQNKAKIEYVYIEKKSKANDIVSKSDNLNKPECKMSELEVKQFNELTRKVK